MTNNLENRMAARTQGDNKPSVQGASLKQLLAAPAMKKRFDEVLDKRAPQFMASLLNLYNSEAMLQKADPMSVITSAMVAASLDLPVDKNLGYAWIVPYSGKAQFQMGYKGYIQLALRTGQYRALNVVDIHEGELVSWNPLTEELTVDFTKKKSDVIVGYAGYFELVNGFRKAVYWTKEQIETHKKKFSKSDFGWKRDYDAMARKTVIRSMLSKWGILSIDMQRATSDDIEADEGGRQSSDDTFEGIDLKDEDFAISPDDIPN